ncbi:hypothetical protein BKH41_06765 [Helicobacter sp. 12S02232-10]|uniref:hypothetical protein n=1 Tax=Helicobacter sp. 12S02232-10 TaxID=1476197 RepID=UPI000BA716FF|nr:hypothetical protein [Helicobacter sp. 12S02232-10]PAF47955.1 hypothetical protein BKH41_06765 [Helicobacter sp. 12S02232-10]
MLELGVPKKNFWDKVKVISQENDMNEVLSYMFLHYPKKQKKRERPKKLRQMNLKNMGRKILNFLIESIKIQKKETWKSNIIVISFDTKEMINATIILESILKNLYIII